MTQNYGSPEPATIPIRREIKGGVPIFCDVLVGLDAD